jgi:hypothetical protein
MEVREMPEIVADGRDVDAEDVGLRGPGGEEGQSADAEHDPAVEDVAIDGERQRVAQASMFHVRSTVPDG